MTVLRALLLMVLTVPTYADDSAAIDALMRAYSGEGPGAAAVVIRNGRPETHVYGYADLEGRSKVTPSTNFRLASVTKQFTAAAVLLLAEDGKLSIDDRVKRWLPSLPAAADVITLRQLLTHTSGLIDYEDVIPASMTSQLHDSDVLRLLESQDRTYFAPSSSYGFGWRITGETLWHSGETIGFRNVIVRYPQRRLTVIVLTNRDDPEPYRTALAIADSVRH